VIDAEVGECREKALWGRRSREQYVTGTPSDLSESSAGSDGVRRQARRGAGCDCRFCRRQGQIGEEGMAGVRGLPEVEAKGAAGGGAARRLGEESHEQVSRCSKCPGWSWCRLRWLTGEAQGFSALGGVATLSVAGGLQRSAELGGCCCTAARVWSPCLDAARMKSRRATCVSLTPIRRSLPAPWPQARHIRSRSRTSSSLIFGPAESRARRLDSMLGPARIAKL
jgi:hypothetical protein